MGNFYMVWDQGKLVSFVLVVVMIMLGSSDVFSQRSIQGKVVDQNDDPLIGVNIMIAGTARGAITDFDGNFRIDNINGEDVLVVSYVGFESQEVRIGNESVLNIILANSSSMLDEVVVVGYGTTSRRNVTGSVSKVDMSQMENLPTTNVTQALRGRVAGVQFTDNGRPGQNGSILIRGPRSLSAGNDPLIVLDGIFFNGSLIDINPNDIESMEILKDASAAAIYGSRAANGVILITSKQGQTEKPVINVSTFAGVSDWVSRLQLLTPERYFEKSMEIRRLRDIPFDPNDVSTFLTITEADNFRNGNVVDPFDLISQQGRIFSGDISISGKSKNSNYYLSGSMTREQGLIKDDNLNRLAFRANLENKVTDWLTIGTQTMFSENDQSGVPASLSLATRQSPFGTWFREDGSPTPFTVPEDQGTSSNPLRNNWLSENLNIRNNLFANFFTVVKIPKIEGLSFRVNYSTNYRWIRDYFTTRNDIHLPDENISFARKRNWKANDWVLENILDYKFQITNKHIFDVTLMYGSNRNFNETTTARADRLEFDEFGWNRLNVGDLQTVSSFAQEVTGVSSMARINYRFNDRYLFTLTARRDGSSVFAANNKYAVFPSGSFAWIVSEESFLKNSDFVNFLKLRTSYGAVGNQAISPYQSLSLASINYYVFGPNTALGIFPSNIPNENLKWETTYTANIAIDFEMFKRRIGGTIEFYNMDTRDLLVERSIPIMTGYSSIWTNLGQVNNRGLEVTLNTVNYRSGKFEWSSNFVFSHNQNKIVSLYGVDSNGDGREDDDIGNSWFIGQPIDVYYDFVFDGIYQVGDELPPGAQPGFARFQDLNGDGIINAEFDRTIIGNSGQPRFRWGIGNNFSYGNLELSIFVNAMQGWTGAFNEMDFYTNSIDPGRPGNMFDNGWWTPENMSTTRPSLEYRRTTLGHNWYLSRNFIRIQDVALSYRFSPDMIRKRNMNNLSIFMSARNLVTFTDWLGPNPETIADNYPMPRSVTLGLKVGL